MTRHAIRQILCVGAAVFVLALKAATTVFGAPANLGASIAGPVVSDTAAAIQAALSENDSRGLTLALRDLTQLRQLYSERKFQPIWSGSAEAQERASLSRQVLTRADEQGLNTADYAIKTVPAGSAGRRSAEDDIELTRVVLRYARDVRIGRLPPNAVYGDADLPEQKFDPAAALAAALRDGKLSNFFADLPPPHVGYRRLVAGLARYRAIASRGGWPTIPAGVELEFGGGDPRLDLLKARLAAESPDAAPLGENELMAAVKRYQTQQGLAPDGRVGQLTKEMLNIPASERVAQIAANMERWRWLPRMFERRFVVVNVPDQSLQFVEDGVVTLTSRVIVGRPQTPTPIFRASAVAVTANPPWNVPQSIAVKEILPKLKSNPNYLVSQDMILLNGPAGDPAGVHVDWRKLTANNFPYRIQQVPGTMNALGNLKLELPNRFDVYLHDTPGKAAFERAQRALSHGCIRVQQISPLAALALGGDRDAARSTLDAAIGTGTTQQIKLNDPLPIYVLYWTAMAEEDGSVAFRRDLYGRDRRLNTGLANRVREARLAMYTGGCQILPG
jgi:L,D-transpeptidase YcbB